MKPVSATRSFVAALRADLILEQDVGFVLSPCGARWYNNLGRVDKVPDPQLARADERDADVAG